MHPVPLSLGNHHPPQMWLHWKALGNQFDLMLVQCTSMPGKCIILSSGQESPGNCSTVSELFLLSTQSFSSAGSGNSGKVSCPWRKGTLHIAHVHADMQLYLRWSYLGLCLPNVYTWIFWIDTFFSICLFIYLLCLQITVYTFKCCSYLKTIR